MKAVSNTTVKIIFDHQQKIHHTAPPRLAAHLDFAIKVSTLRAKFTHLFIIGLT